MNGSEKPISHFLENLPSQHAQSLTNLYNHLGKNYNDAFGSATKHQAWEGGYFNHIQDMLNLASQLYPTFDDFGNETLPFKLNETYPIILLHDIEKPIKYTKNRTQEVLQLQEKTPIQIREYFANKFAIILDEKEKHALKYMHGEGDDYHPKKRIMSELGAFCHIIDTTSARIFHNKDNPHQYKDK